MRIHMKKTTLLGTLTIAAIAAAGMAPAQTLEDTKTRGTVLCGVTEGTLGFSARNSEGKHEGFDVDFC